MSRDDAHEVPVIEEKNPEEVLLDDITRDLNEYNDIVNASIAKIEDGITTIDVVLRNTVTNYNEMLKSERYKYSMITAETGKSISSLVKEEISLMTTKVNISKARVEHNMKTRTVLKELKKIAASDGKKTTSTFSPLDFINSMNKAFQQ